MAIGPERIGRVIRKTVENTVPDLMEKFPSPNTASRAERTLEKPEDAELLTEQFFQFEGRELRAELEAEIAKLPYGWSRARYLAGHVEKGTRHPHDFYVNKGEGESTLYFVDPEHQVGKAANKGLLPRSGDFRPHVGGLIGIRFEEGKVAPDMSILRFRTNKIKDRHTLKMSEQFEAAKEFFATGEVPVFLGELPREVTFHLEVRPDKMSVQSRGASSEQLERFLEGEAMTPTLRGKLHAYSLITTHFITHMQNGGFKPFAEKETPQSA